MAVRLPRVGGSNGRAELGRGKPGGAAAHKEAGHNLPPNPKPLPRLQRLTLAYSVLLPFYSGHRSK